MPTKSRHPAAALLITLKPLTTMTSEIYYMIFLLSLAAAVQYYELVYQYKHTFGKPKADTKPLAPIERINTKVIALLLLSSLTSCNLIVPLGEQSYTALRTIKKGASGDGLNDRVIWRGDDLHMTVKFMPNCWYPVKSDGYGKDLSILNVGGVGEWTKPFDFHRTNSARAGWIPSTKPDSIEVGTFVHFLQNTSHQYAMTVKTGDDWQCHIHNSIPERKYIFTFTYKTKVVTIYEPMGDLGTGYLLGFHGGGDTYQAPQDMTVLLRYTER